MARKISQNKLAYKKFSLKLIVFAPSFVNKVYFIYFYWCQFTGRSSHCSTGTVARCSYCLLSHQNKPQEAQRQQNLSRKPAKKQDVQLK